ncbi:MAG: peptidyl-prolyl cis-trans isomerase [Candidatus Aenigmarchaeota archaeon]|nr:peptidyl-prolyl cis-trans isomerase [Candidatus Aenigmarchaeota archaeon]
MIFHFGKIALEVSQCPSRKEGGDLGLFGRGMMVRPFEKVAFELEKGQLSEPIKTEFGWHVIKRTA